jgi:hypothetical protein
MAAETHSAPSAGRRETSDSKFMAHPLRLEITYSNNKPVALLDLTKSLNAFSDQYRRTIKQHSSTFEDDKVRLYVTGIRSGSIIAQLMPLLPVGSGLVENARYLREFCNYLRDSYSYLLSGPRPAVPLDHRDLKNLGSIVEPVSREFGSRLIFSGPFKQNAREDFSISTTNAVAIKRAIRVEEDRLKAPNTQVLDDVELYWYQARNDRSSQAGDRAVIPDVHDKPVKVIFSDEAVKRRMLLDYGNPFRLSYKVDVVADFSGRTPKIYRIVAVRSVS